MSYGDARHQLQTLRAEIDGIRAKMRSVLDAVEPEPVGDHVFVAASVSLSDLFGDMRELIIVHNMGASCAYCTLWADGYNGLYPHIRTRAAFVVASPDAPERQQEFARERGWRFPMVSDEGAAFARKMGYASADGACRPGLSIFQRGDGGAMVRVMDANSCPHDDFCAVWHLFDLLPGGANGWRPRLRYDAKA